MTQEEKEKVLGNINKEIEAACNEMVKWKEKQYHRALLDTLIKAGANPGIIYNFIKIYKTWLQTGFLLKYDKRRKYLRTLRKSR